MDRALLHVDNCYFFQHIRAEEVPCKTAQVFHTTFRGVDVPQGMVVA
jgi:xanthine dehydrogenase molybdopterin-binding subunit B